MQYVFVDIKRLIASIQIGSVALNTPLSPAAIEVAPGIHAWIGVSGASNSGAIETPQGLVLIDAQESARQGLQFREKIENALQKPTSFLIDSHFHLDHTAGNTSFSDVTILAHEKTATLLEEMLGPRTGDEWHVTDDDLKLKLFFGSNITDLVSKADPGFAWFKARIDAPNYANVALRPPEQLFSDRFEIVLPNDILRCSYLGPAHCDGDIVIHLLRGGVVFLGDLLFVNRVPWLGDCDLDGWIARLDAVTMLDVTTVIPGHGPPAKLSDVAAFRDLLSAIREAADNAIAAGWSEDAAARTPLPQYAQMQRYETWMPYNIRAAYRYLKGA